MTEATGVETTPREDAPAVGLHPDVPMEEYRDWPGASQSRLKVIRDKSPAHLRYMMENPQPSTKAQKLGAAIHTAVLEPEVFHARYAVIGRCEGEKKDGDRCANSGSVLTADGRSLCGVHAGGAEIDDERVILPRSKYEQSQAIYKSVRAHPFARTLLGGHAERSAVWEDPETGVLCKGRFDDIAPEGVGALVDLKTTTDASPRAFERAIYKFGYYMQAAFYLTGAQALGEPVEDFAIIAVEKDPPYAVAVYRIRADALGAGRDELKPLLARYAECVRDDHWPAYPREVRDIALPPWAWKQVDERVGRI